MPSTIKLAVAMGLLAACATEDPTNPGDDGVDPGDTDPGDGNPDDPGTTTPEPMPEPGYINVVVTSSYTGALQSQRRVIFSRPDGSVAADTLTDDQGVASAQLEAGYVTIVRDGSTGPRSKIVQTVLDVHAGDTVRFGPDPADPSAAGVATVTHDAVPSDQRVTTYTPCKTGHGFDFGATTLQVQVQPGRCSSNIPVISAAGTWDSNNFSDDPQQFSVVAGATLEAGGTIAMPAWAPAQTTQLSISGVPSGISIQYGLQASMLVGRVQVYSQYKNSAPTFNGTNATSWKRPQGFGDAWLFEASWKNSNDSFLGSVMFAMEGAPQDTLTMPYASMRARWLLRPYVLLSETPKLRWAAEGTDDADIGWIEIGYGNTTHGVAWTILGPAPTSTAGDIVLPKLPDDLKLLPNDSVSKARLATIAVDGASYADLREHVAFYMANAIELDWYDWTGNGEIVRELARLPNVTGARIALSPRP